MPFNIDERVKLSTKVLAAGVIDGFEDAQWYESRFANSFSSLASDVYGLSPTTGFAYVTNNPAPNLAAAQTAAAAAPTVIEDWTQGGVAYAGTAVQGSTAVRLTPVTGTNDVNGFSTFAAYVVYNDFSSQRLTNWIKPQSVPQASGAPSIGYSVSLYNGDPNAGGTLISTAAGQGGSPAEVGWIFNADTGLLFLAEDFRATVQDPYIVGFRYIGDTLAAVAGASPVEVVDGDGDTFVRVEQTPDEDTIRISAGDNTGDRDGTDLISVNVADTRISGADALNPSAFGGNVTIEAGAGDPTNFGGTTRIFGGDNGGFVRIFAGSGIAGSDFRGGNVLIGAGSGDGAGITGDMRFFPGAAGATSGTRDGEIQFFTIAAAGVTPSKVRWYSTGTTGISLEAPAGMTANVDYVLPGTDGTNGQLLTTDGAGNLSWNTISGSELIDTDGDTFVRVEETADEDIIRMSVGDNTGEFDVSSDLVTIGTGGITLRTPDGIGTTNVPNLSLETGDGAPSPGASPGRIRMVGGNSGVGSNQTPPSLLFRAGNGDGTGNGGDIVFQPGSSTGTGARGAARIRGGAPLIIAQDGNQIGVGFRSPTPTATPTVDIVWTLPPTIGGANEVLTNDGTGILSWAAPVSRQLIDTDGDTSVEVERTADNDTIHLRTAGTDIGVLTDAESTISTASGLYEFIISDTSVIVGEPGAGSRMTIGNNTFFNGVTNNGTTVPNSGLSTIDNVTGDLNYALATANGTFVTTEIAGASGITSFQTRLSDGSFRALTSDTTGNFAVAGIPMIDGSVTGLTLRTPDATAGTAGSGPIEIIGGISRANFGGGAINITGGALDASVTSVFASAGNITITGGENASNSGSAGSLLFRAGSATAGNGRGGSAVFSAGNGFGSGFGGSVTIQAGQGGATGAPGQFTFQAGNALPTSNANGGTAFIQGGNGAGTGDGGVLNISSGSNTSGTGDGGFFNFNAGTGVNGGSFEMFAGDATAGNNGNGGSFLLEAGAGDGTGDNGSIVLRTEGDNTLRVSDVDALGLAANYPGIGMSRTVGPRTYFMGVGDATAFGGTDNTTTGWIDTNNASLTTNVDANGALFSFVDPVTPANNMSLGVNVLAQRIQAQLGGANAFFIENTGVAYRSTLLSPSNNAGETHELRFEELGPTNNNYVGFKAPDTITTDTMWTLPNADGTAGQVLSTDGSGNLSWTTASGSAANNFERWTRTGNGSGDVFIEADNPTDNVNIEGGRGLTIAMSDATDTVRFDFTRTGLGDTPVTLLDSVPMFDNSNGNLPGYRSWSDVINDLNLSTALKTLFGSRAAPVAVGTAGLPLVFTNDNLVFIQGNGGPVTVTAATQIAAAGNVGDELKIIGRSNTNTVTFTNGNGLSLNGSVTLGEDDTISLIWDSTNWVELSRNV